MKIIYFKKIYTYLSLRRAEWLLVPTFFFLSFFQKSFYEVLEWCHFFCFAYFFDFNFFRPLGNMLGYFVYGQFDPCVIGDFGYLGLLALGQLVCWVIGDFGHIFGLKFVFFFACCFIFYICFLQLFNLIMNYFLILKPAFGNILFKCIWKFNLIFIFRWKNWKRRWFVLNDRCLYYFQYSAENVPKGIVPLENVKVLFQKWLLFCKFFL